MKKIFLDANVLLEILFRRTRYDSILTLLSSMNNVRFCVSALSLDIVVYFVESEGQSKDVAWEFLSKYEVLGVSPQDTQWAHANDQGDFEDALQVACARRHNCAQIVTLDRKLGRMYGKYITTETVR